MDWITLVQDGARWWELSNAVVRNFRVQYNAGNLTTRATVSFSAKTRLRGFSYLYPASFTIQNILAEYENSGIQPLWRHTLSDEDFKASPIGCGGSNEPSILTALSVGLTSSIAQVGSSLGRKATPEHICPRPRAAPTVSRNDGQVKRKSRILCHLRRNEFRDFLPRDDRLRTGWLLKDCSSE